MAIALVRSAAIPGSAVGGTSAPVDTTGANLLVVSAAWFTADTPPTDSFSNVWTEAIAESAGGFGLGIYYALNPTVGANHTFSLSGQFASGSMQAFSGVLAVGTSVGNATGSGSSAQPGSLTPASNGTLLVAAISENAAPTDLSVVVNSSFTLTTQQPFTSGQFFGSAAAYLVQGTAAAVNPTFSWTGSASQVNAAMVQFSAKPVASGVRNALMMLGCGT